MVFRLFREEAVAHASRRLSGEVVLASPLGLRLVSLTLLGLLVVAAAFATTATYTRKETLAGVVVPEGGIVRAVARQGGLLIDLKVTVGQTVTDGQVLATVSRADTTRSGDVAELLGGTLQQERRTVLSDAEASRTMLREERARLLRDIESLAQEEVEARSRLAVQERQVELAEGELARARGIADRGFLPLREVEARQAAVLNAQSQLSSLRSTLIAQRRERRRVELEMKQYDERLSILNGEASRAIAGIDQRRIELERGQIYLVTAPASGVVSAIPARLGSELEPGAPVVVVSAGGPRQEYVAEIAVPSASSGFLRPGQPVRISVDAFPHQRYGKFDGVLQEISNIPLQSENFQGLGETASTPVYRGIVRFREQGVTVQRKRQPFRTGMTLQADVATERRSLLGWLLDPLYSALRRE